MTKINLTLLTLVFSFWACRANDPVPGDQQNKPIEITIGKNLPVVVDKMIGNGVQWSAYPHADSPEASWGDAITHTKWDTLYQRLDRMKPSFMRIIDQANWRYYKGLDGRGVPVLSFDNPRTRTLFKLLDYCQSRNISVTIGEWGSPYTKHDLGDTVNIIETAGDPRWISMIGQWIEYLLKYKKYNCIKYYDFINEPNGYWASTEGNWAEWADGIRKLHAEFKSRGLNIEIAGPGSVPQYTVEKYRGIVNGDEWVKYSADSLNEYIGAYNTHVYPSFDHVWQNKVAALVNLPEDVAIAKRKNNQFFVGELGIKADQGSVREEQLKRIAADGFTGDDCNMFVYDYRYGIDFANAAIQCFKAGAGGVIAWDLDDAMHTQGDMGDRHKLKRWGFWNILGTELCNRPEDENIRPWFYTWSWFCRFMPPGSTLLDIVCQNNQIKAIASELNGAYSVFILNTGEDEVNCSIALPSSIQFNVFTYSRKSMATQQPDILSRTFTSNQYQSVLPPMSLTVLTSMK